MHKHKQNKPLISAAHLAIFKLSLILAVEHFVNMNDTDQEECLCGGSIDNTARYVMIANRSLQS